MERDVVDQVSALLRLPRRRRQIISRELRTHLEESRRDLQLSGMPADQAAREGIARLGDPHEIAGAFGEVYRPSRRRRVGLAFALAGALLTGAYGFSGTLASATSSAHHRPAVQIRVTHQSHHHRSRR
jgi:hypothetical protein